MPPMVCPDLMSTGSCTTPGCSFNHTTFSCDLCKIICPSQGVLKSHLQGKQHKKKLASGATGWKRCPICDVSFPGSPANVTVHQRGTRHQNNVLARRQLGLSIPPMEETRQPHTITCDDCEMDIAPQIWVSHVLGPKHLRRLRYVAYKDALEESASDKNDIIIVQDQLDFGQIDSESLPRHPTRQKVFHVISRERDVLVTDVRMSSSLGPYARFKAIK